MFKKLVAVTAVLAIAAPVALGAAHFVKVSPGTVKAGEKVTVSGSVGNGCEVGHKGDSATIYSFAFKGSTGQDFAGVPAVFASLDKHGKFSFKITINKKKVAKGKYPVSGRCGGGHFGSTTLNVT